MIKKETIERVKAAGRLEDYVPDLRKTGANLYTQCPFCLCFDTKKKRGIVVTPKKNMAKCFHCGESVVGPISWLMKVKHYSFIDAIIAIANDCGIEIEYDEQEEKRIKQRQEKKTAIKRDTFCHLQLKSSGLTTDDILAQIKETETTKETSPFKSGTRDTFGRYSMDGDDMLIYYYNLEGNPVTYLDKNKKAKHLIRVRWHNPELHKDKSGKGIKYQSPAGSGTHIYIPERIRHLYQTCRTIDTLYIQEGEKKAEKASLHGIPSIGVMGIQNIGWKGRSLPPELQYIIQRCEVKNLVFILDSDWDKLSQKLESGDQVDQRPKSFFYAIKNYKEYTNTLKALDLNVETYFGHINDNEKGDKGIDDLLANTLKEDPASLKADLLATFHLKDGKNRYVGKHSTLYKITTMTDAQLLEIWDLDNAQKFAERHKAQLQELDEFKIGKYKRRFSEKGELEMAQPLLDTEKFWSEEWKEKKNGDEYQVLHFAYGNCFTFLQNRGFWIYERPTGEREFIHIEDRKVKKVDHFYIRNYVTSFCKAISLKAVLEMLYKGGPQYLGHEKLSNLDEFPLQLEAATPTLQNLYFNNEVWRITSDKIEKKKYQQLRDCLWEDEVIKRKIELKENLLKITYVTDENQDQLPPQYRGYPKGEFIIEFTKTGKRCHFLQFLANTSNFHWKKEKRGQKINHTEMAENNRHFLSKLTAIGYLAHDYKNASELKAVICVDGKMSEIGASNGRTGKSLMGLAIEHIVPQVYIPAKSKNLTEDTFIWDGVTEKIRNIFLDDVRVNLDFEFFFPLITGKLKVNPKGGKPYTLTTQETPKLLISTNHAINGDSSSFRDRQAFCAFSDFYNENHKPVNDFGCNFFEEWDDDQWELFYNMAATCLQVYFKAKEEGWTKPNQGIVSPPMDSVKRRQLRQQIGEELLEWAEVYYYQEPDGAVSDGSMLNKDIEKQIVYENFLDLFPNARKYTTITKFKRKLIDFCKYKGFNFNPNKENREGINITDARSEESGDSVTIFEGIADKRHGKEFITISNTRYNTMPF